MSAYQPDRAALSYSARFCRRCGAAMERRPGVFNRTAWRCTQCKPLSAGR